MYGGLTGFGAHPSLGGLLIGGVKKADMTPAQLATYERALQRSKEKRAAYRAEMAAKGTPLRTVGVRKAKAPSKAGHARRMLQRLIDAENMGAEALLREDHPDLAEYLDDDMAYNINLRDSGRRPKWLLDKYSGKPGRELYPPVSVGNRLSADELQARKKALEGAPIWEYISKNGKTTKFVKEGSSEFQRIMAMKSVQNGEARFSRIGPQFGPPRRGQAMFA